MEETNQSLSELWSLLRNKEEQFGLNELSLTDRDILQAIIHIQGKDKKTRLETILRQCPHPRATFFRCLKTLRVNHFIEVIKDTEDLRKSYIKVSHKFRN